MKIRSYHLLWIATVICCLLVFQGCKKFEIDTQSVASVPYKIQSHNEKVQNWFKTLPINGTFKYWDPTKHKTIAKDSSLITRIEVPNTGSAFYFISYKNTFTAYAVKSISLTKTARSTNGEVKLFDFQNMKITGLRYKDGILQKIIRYSQDGFNGKPKAGPINFREAGVVTAIRKFFCELFGGTWLNSIAENADNPNGSCASGGDGGNEELPPPDSGGGQTGSLSFFWNQVNSPNLYFDNGFFGSFTSALGPYSPSATTGSAVDAVLGGAEQLKSLYYSLCQQLNQTPFGLDENFTSLISQFNTPVSPSIKAIALVAKAGSVNAAAQFFYEAANNMLDDNTSLNLTSAIGNVNTTRVLNATNNGLFGIANGTVVRESMEDVIEYILTHNDVSMEDALMHFLNKSLNKAVGNTGANYLSDQDFLQRLAEVKNEFNQNPFLTIGCGFLTQFYNLSQFQPPLAVTNKLYDLNNSHPGDFQFQYAIQDLKDAVGKVLNCDYFVVKITSMPVVNGVQLTNDDLLDYFRRHINDFFDRQNPVFVPYTYNHNGNIVNEANLWNSADPTGALLHIDLVSLSILPFLHDDGTVIVSQFTGDSYTVNTVYTPKDLEHPVSGVRRWKVFDVTSGPDAGSKYFYTSGVDKSRSVFTSILNELTNIGFSQADQLWSGMQNKMGAWINNNGGNAAVKTPVIARPSWMSIAKLITGQITLAQYKAQIGC